ncbi:MAG: serine/threonine-protein phosphatase [Oscillospiraceae bacterium]|nr:serine/threonine-protein phosphatase [Oscillospiraceae bacterium]
MFYCCAITDKGVRPHNEDAFMIHHTVLTEGVTEAVVSAPFLAAVADGVSGEQSGELASSMCLDLLKDLRFTSRMDLADVLEDIHDQLAARGRLDPENFNMQTTLCGIAVDEQGLLHTFNVGDSRLYRYRRGCLSQLSRDQSLVQLLFEEGTITREEKQHHIHRNIIFPVLGNLSSLPQFDIRTLNEEIEYGDVLLLCSDGLSDYADTAEMEEILAMPKPLVRRLRLLADKALENQSTDNITIVAVMRSNAGK